jgi:predicted RNase H-like HicB family nuclease
MRQINATLAFDDEARVWWVEACDVGGVRLEADTIDALIERLPNAIADIWEASAQAENKETRK